MDNVKAGFDEKLNSRATTTLVFGIISVVAPLVGLNIVGLVFAIMTLARLKGAKDETTPDPIRKKLTAAHILGIIGLITSIVFLILTVLFMIGAIIYVIINGVIAIISAIGVLISTVLTALTPFLGAALAALIEQLVVSIVEAVLTAMFEELASAALLLALI